MALVAFCCASSGELGLAIVLATPAWFCVAAAIRRDAHTGFSTGVVEFGWDPWCRHCAVPSGPGDGQ